MEAILRRCVPDQSIGRMHHPGEHVSILRTYRQSDFSDRMMYSVQFEDGSRGAVFVEEVGQGLDTTCITR